jgi:hypothetical protein
VEINAEAPVIIRDEIFIGAPIERIWHPDRRFELAQLAARCRQRGG